MTEIIPKTLEETKKHNFAMKEKSAWQELDTEAMNGIIQKINREDDEIDWDKFTYNNAYDYNYYKKKFPKFDDEVIEILVRTSGKTLHDVFKKVEKNISD